MKNTLERKVSLEEIAYYVMFSLLLCLKGFGLDESSILFRIGLVCAFGFFIIKILLGKYSIIEAVLIVVGLLWGGYIFYNVGSLAIFIYALIVFGMKNISVGKVMKIGTIVWTVCISVTITAAIFLERYGGRVIHEKFGLGAVLRESLGYAHPNVLHISYILLMIFVLYLCKKDNLLKVSIGLLVGSIFIFMYSMSYTGMLISFLIVVVNFYYVFRSTISRCEKIITRCVLPCCIVLSTIFPVYLDSYGFWYDFLNPLVNNRIWIIKHYFYLYHPTLLGEKILTQNLSLDNSYVYAIGWYGILFFVVMMVAYGLMINKYILQDRRKELAVVMTFLIAGLTEQFLFNASIKNITFVFMGEFLFECLEKKNSQLLLLSKWNYEYSIEIDVLSKMRLRLQNLKCLQIVGWYILINLMVLIFLSPIHLCKYTEVYANEKVCDCGGQLVDRQEIRINANTLIIGELTADDQYYYFNKNNSNLIRIMEWRYKITYSVYISIIIMGGVLVLKSRRIKE